MLKFAGRIGENLHEITYLKPGIRALVKFGVEMKICIGLNTKIQKAIDELIHKLS